MKYGFILAISPVVVIALFLFAAAFIFTIQATKPLARPSPQPSPSPATKNQGLQGGWPGNAVQSPCTGCAMPQGREF